jgi:hypothetical protein
MRGLETSRQPGVANEPAEGPLVRNRDPYAAQQLLLHKAGPSPRLFPQRLDLDHLPLVDEPEKLREHILAMHEMQRDATDHLRWKCDCPREHGVQPPTKKHVDMAGLTKKLPSPGDRTFFERDTVLFGAPLARFLVSKAAILPSMWRPGEKRTLQLQEEFNRSDQEDLRVRQRLSGDALTETDLFHQPPIDWDRVMSEESTEERESRINHDFAAGPSLLQPGARENAARGEEEMIPADASSAADEEKGNIEGTAAKRQRVL